MHFREGVNTSGAANEDLSVILGVDVDEPFGPEHAVLQFHSTRQTRLFVYREETFDSGVSQFFVGDSGQRHGDTDTVVCAEGRSLGFKEISIDIGLDRIFQEVMLYIAVFLGHHIHVRLKDNAFMIFISRRSGYTHDDIHRLIDDTFDTMLRRKILQPTTNTLLVLRWTRHLANLLKNSKHLFGFHI